MRFVVYYKAKRIAATFDGTAWSLLIDGAKAAANRPNFFGITVLQATLKISNEVQIPILVRVHQFPFTTCTLKIEGERIGMPQLNP